jgi:hypothetical protein
MNPTLAGLSVFSKEITVPDPSPRVGISLFYWIQKKPRDWDYHHLSHSEV